MRAAALSQAGPAGRAGPIRGAAGRGKRSKRTPARRFSLMPVILVIHSRKPLGPNHIP